MPGLARFGALAAGGIFALALLIRLAHLHQLRDSPFASVLMGDAKGYDAWARQLAAGDWIGSQVFYQAPLYPYFMGAVYSLFGADLATLRAVQAVIGAFSCVLVGLAGARWFSPAVGIGTGVALALYAPAIFLDGLIQKSVLDLFFICAALALLGALHRFPALAPGGDGPAVHVQGGRVPRSVVWVVLGMVAGCLALTRENALVLIPLIALWAWHAPRPARWPAWRSALLVLIGTGSVLAPVAIRNYAVDGGFYLTTSQFGPNFFIGNNPQADGTYMSLRFGRGSPEYERLDATELAERARGRRLTPGEVSSYWTERAFDFALGQPAAWLRLQLRKAALFVNADEMLDTEAQESHAVYSWPLRVLGPVTHFGVLVPLGVFGMVLAWPQRQRLWVLYALALAYTLSTVAFFVFARYRYPVVPILLLFAAAGIGVIWRTVKVRPTSRAEGPVAAAVADLSAGREAHHSAGRRAHHAAGPGAHHSTGRGEDHSARGGADLPAGRGADDSGGGGADYSAGRGADLYGPPITSAILAAAVAAIVANWPMLSADEMRAITATNVGTAYFEQQRFAEASTHYREALALRPDYAPAYNNLGVTLRAQGRVDEAIATYREGLRRRGDYPDLRYNLANALLEQGKAQEAGEQLNVASAALPDSAGVHNNLAQALAAQGRTEEAALELRKALALEPDSAKVHRNLGNLLASRGETEAALIHLRRAVAIDAADPDARYDLGSALLEAGQAADAERELRAGLAVRPRHPETLNNLGIALASQGKLGEARAQWQQALAVRPGFEDAARNLEKAGRE